MRFPWNSHIFARIQWHWGAFPSEPIEPFRQRAPWAGEAGCSGRGLAGLRRGLGTVRAPIRWFCLSRSSISININNVNIDGINGGLILMSIDILMGCIMITGMNNGIQWLILISRIDNDKSCWYNGIVSSSCFIFLLFWKNDFEVKRRDE